MANSSVHCNDISQPFICGVRLLSTFHPIIALSSYASRMFCSVDTPVNSVLCRTEVEEVFA